jgi:hypothetical protein
MELPRTAGDRALWAVVVAGLLLRLWQYLGGASLWLDELALSHNLVDHGFVDLLTRPLDYSQVAPAGFLAVERLSYLALGDSEYAWRVLPLAVGLASVPLFAWLARRLLDDVEALAATALFAVSPSLILFSAILKPYAVDVVAVLALSVCAARCRTTPLAFVAWVAAATIAPWFSNAAVLATAGVLAAMLWFDLRERRFVRARVTGHAVVVMSLALVAAHASHQVTAETLAFFDRYWSASFPPWPPRSVRDVLWPGRAFAQLVALVLPQWNPGALLPPRPAMVSVAIMPIVCTLGAWRLWLRDRDATTILVAPAVVVLVASFLHRYPISNRLVLWLAPLVIVTMVAGLAYIGRRLARGAWLHRTLLVALVGFGLYGLVLQPPVRRIQEFGPLAHELKARWQDGDIVLLHHASRLAMAWYGPRAGLPMDRMWWSECAGGDARLLLHELDRVRGRRRAWFAASSVYLDSGETLAVLGYLDAIGTRLALLEMQGSNEGGPIGAWAILYDLSDPQRLSRAEAASFELPPPATGEPPWWPPGYCGGPENARPDALPATPGR